MTDILSTQHPGETIRGAIEELGLIYDRQFALRIGVSAKHLCQLLAGKVPLSVPIALRIEQVTGIPAELLMRMQIRYDVAQWKLRESSLP